MFDAAPQTGLGFGGRALTLVLISAAFAFACKKNDQDAQTAGYSQGQTQPPPGTQPAPGQPGTQPAPGQPGTQPGPSPTPPPPTPVQPLDAAAAVVVQPILNELAKKETQPGAKAIGTAMVANFQTNQVLETQIQLQPNKCYTVVATSLPPVTELNVQIVAVAPLPGLAPVLATDSDTGPNAVLGRKPNCYKWALPLPAPAKVVVQVAGGSGLAAAQLYEK